MSQLFGDCGQLTSLNLANFDISNVQDIFHMFQNYISLTSLDVSKFDSSIAIDTSSMTSHFVASKVTNTTKMIQFT